MTLFPTKIKHIYEEIWHISINIITLFQCYFNSLECSYIMNSGYLKAIAFSSFNFWMDKLSVGISIVVYLVVLDIPLDSATVFIVIGLFNVIKYDCGIQLPLAIQYGFEIRTSLSRIQVIN